MPDPLQALLQHILPKASLTKVAGRIAGSHRGKATTSLIRWFVARYGVDMNEAAEPDIASYQSFNEFFTRPLKNGARRVANADFVSPVDGAISQLGTIDDHHIIQAKGHRFTVSDLLGGDAEVAELFRHGSFANLYLSPRDYHRIHMPCAGALRRMTHIPGAFYSVNPATARSIPRLFARNERVVCLFDSPDHGTFAMVLVGATIVGSMATVWHGVIRPEQRKGTSAWHYDDQSIVLQQGEEMGRFLLGSTVILLFQPGVIEFPMDWAPERSVRLGERLGDKPRQAASAAST